MPGLMPEERKHGIVEHESVHPDPAGNADDVERRAAIEGCGGGEAQAGDGPDRIKRLPDEMHPGIGQGSEHLIGSSEVELLDIGENEKANGEGQGCCSGWMDAARIGSNDLERDWGTCLLSWTSERAASTEDGCKCAAGPPITSDN